MNAPCAFVLVCVFLNVVHDKVPAPCCFGFACERHGKQPPADVMRSFAHNSHTGSWHADEHVRRGGRASQSIAHRDCDCIEPLLSVVRSHAHEGEAGATEKLLRRQVELSLCLCTLCAVLFLTLWNGPTCVAEHGAAAAAAHHGLRRLDDAVARVADEPPVGCLLAIYFTDRPDQRAFVDTGRHTQVPRPVRHDDPSPHGAHGGDSPLDIGRQHRARSPEGPVRHSHHLKQHNAHEPLKKCGRRRVCLAACTR